MINKESIPVKRVLVIDDNAAIHEDFCKILIEKQPLGANFLDMESQLFGAEVQNQAIASFEIHSAFQGREGFELVKKAKSEGHPYALAFIDGRMPPGWDGIETIKYLWKECPDLQVVLCTAYADYSWQEIFRVLGKTDNLLILKKPFENVEVLQMAHSLTRKWELAREVQYRIENLDDLVRREIGERKQVEEELQIKNWVFETAITANSITNTEGIITNINKIFLKMWGYQKKEDVLGKPVSRFHKFETEAGRIITTLDQTGIWEGEFIALKKDGSTFSAYGLATTVKNLSEDIIGYQAAVIDISDRKKAENEKIEAQKIAAENEKLALVGQIAGKMAHDFNNLLGIIMGHSELALLKYEDLEIRNTFELIYNQTLRGENLTKNLISFAKSAEPKQEVFSMNEQVDFVLKLLKNDLKKIEILKDDLNKIDVLADPGMIEHTLVNLIQNSIHATSLTKNPQIIIRVYCSKQTAVLEVEDNGCGIPEEHMKNIYEPSFTLKGCQDVHGRYSKGIKGTGYGMANVKKYIKLHNGNVLVESDIDTGTKVTITLPMIQKQLTREEVLEIQRTKNYTGKYILLVEDEPAISDIQNQILTQSPNHHEVDIASNGQIAIEMLDKNQYDLISLDYMLPGKLNGLDVYYHLRKTNTSVPILFVSGNIEFLESIMMLKQKDPNLAHVTKPCKNIDYLYSINKLFENLTV